MSGQTFKWNGKQFNHVKSGLSNSALKKLLKANAYGVYAAVDEEYEKDGQPDFTIFLVLYSEEFEETVILFDVSRDKKSTVTTDIEALTNGFIEYINIGVVNRYPLTLYINEKGQFNENI